MNLYKTIIVYIMLCFFISHDVNAQQDTTPFRNTSWGMTLEEVKKVDPDIEYYEPLNENQSYDLRYYEKEDVLLGLKVMVRYGFFHNKLLQGQYQTTSIDTTLESALDKYEKFKNALVEKYGEPIKKDVEWPTYLSERASSWSTPKSYIILELYSLFTIAYSAKIIYMDKDWVENQNKYKSEKQEIKDKF